MSAPFHRQAGQQPWPTLSGFFFQYFCFLCLSCAAAALVLTFAAPARADSLPNPGDQYVMGADSPIDPVGVNQTGPALAQANGRLYAIYNDGRPVAGLQNFSRLFYQDITDLKSGDNPPPGLMLTPNGPFTGAYKGQDQVAADGDLVAWREMVTTPSGGFGYQINYTYLGGDGPRTP